MKLVHALIGPTFFRLFLQAIIYNLVNTLIGPSVQAEEMTKPEKMMKMIKTVKEEDEIKAKNTSRLERNNE